jgi:hypothetical protein
MLFYHVNHSVGLAALCDDANILLISQSDGEANPEERLRISQDDSLHRITPALLPGILKII